MIRVIKDDKTTKYYRDMIRKAQVAVSSGKDKEVSDIETLTRLVKHLTTTVSELRKKTINTSASNRPPRKGQGSMSSDINRFLTKTAQKSSSVFQVKQ